MLAAHRRAGCVGTRIELCVIWPALRVETGLHGSQAPGDRRKNNVEAAPTFATAIAQVISPEGCASILWKSAERAPDAADAMGLTADRLKQQGLIDEVVPEPLGGAHRDVAAMADTLQQCLARHLDELLDLPVEELLARRVQRLMGYGRFETGG